MKTRILALTISLLTAAGAIFAQDHDLLKEGEHDITVGVQGFPAPPGFDVMRSSRYVHIPPELPRNSMRFTITLPQGRIWKRCWDD